MFYVNFNDGSLGFLNLLHSFFSRRWPTKSKNKTLRPSFIGFILQWNTEYMGQGSQEWIK